jgi:hypothetical protein
MNSNFSRAISLLLIASAFFLAACSGEKMTKMDTATFDKAFQSAPAEIQAEASKASKAFKEGRYVEGGNTLEEIVKKAGKEGLTEEQKSGFLDVITKAQAIMSENAEKADMKANQAIENAMAALEGRPPYQVGLNPSALDKPPPE